MRHPKYRSEIDGLRAVAVISVLLYHAFPEFITGGFVGVDIFFVISGYLISLIILKELENNTFSIREFFLRRIKRIFPALFIVLFVCLIVGFFLLTPDDFRQLGLHTASGAGFVANLIFCNESGYFDKVAIMKPLLHLWSLGIEEQFYLAWPVLLIAISFLRINAFFVSILIVLSSFFLNFHISDQDSIVAFYSPLTRAWEFSVGFCLATFSLTRASVKSISFGLMSKLIKTEVFFWGRNVFAFIGLLLITYAVVCLNHEALLPSYYALFPVLGAAFIINATRNSWINKALLSNQILVWFGKISYPLYLWHWPILSFIFIWMQGEPAPVLQLSGLFLSIVLAWLTYKFVEVPIRYGNHDVKKVPLLIVLMASVGAVGWFIYYNDGFDIELTPNIEWESFAHKVRVQGNTLCVSKQIEDYKGLWGCEFGDLNSDKKLILYGDSHADAISDELNRTFRKEGIKGIRVWLSNCEPIPFMRRKDLQIDFDDCRQYFQSLLAMMKDKDSDIILAVRWSFRLYPVPGYIDALATKNSEGGRELQLYREFEVDPTFQGGDPVRGKEEALKKFITDLLTTREDVYLIYPIPEMSWDIAKINYRHYKKIGEVLSEISIPYGDFLARSAFVNGVFDSLSDKDNLVRIVPAQIFCNSYLQDRCVAQYDTVPFYLDDDHLSDVGAALLIRDIMSKVGEGSKSL